MSSRNPLSKLVGAQSFYIPPNSEEVAILIYWLNNKTPREIHAQISNLLQGQKVLNDIENLGRILHNLGIITKTEIDAVNDQNVRHCVRCHATYLEKHNGIQACIIQSDLLDIVRTGVGYTPYVAGRHTTRADNVKFNDINVWTCEQLKCGVIDSHVAATDQETSLGNQMTPDPDM